jgi:hypothetical protein
LAITFSSIEKGSWRERAVSCKAFEEFLQKNAGKICYFLPKSAGISPQISVCHFKIGLE